MLILSVGDMLWPSCRVDALTRVHMLSFVFILMGPESSSPHAKAHVVPSPLVLNSTCFIPATPATFQSEC